MLWLFIQDSDQFDQQFRSRYHRPPPWIEALSVDDSADVIWRLSARIGCNPRTISLDKLMAAAWDKMPGRLASHRGEYRGRTEPLAQAVRRLRVPAEGVALIWHPRLNTSLIRLRMKDLVEFGELLWADRTWAFDEKGHWMLVGEHDWPAYFWRFQRQDE